MTPLGRAALAMYVVFNGRPYCRTVTCEGDVESGPYALTYRGFRLGKTRVELSPSGDLLLWLPPKRLRMPWGGWERVPPAYVIEPELGLKERIREEPLPKTTSS